MKFVVSSDLQLHQYRTFARYADGVSSRLKDGLKILRQIRQFCVSRKVGYFVFLGDLFQVRDFVDVTTFNLAYDEIEKFGKEGIECFLLAGNHDQLLRIGITGSLKSFRNVAKVIYEPTVFEVVSEDEECKKWRKVDFNFYFIPFTEDVGSVRKAVKTFAELKMEPCKKFLFLHCSIDGAVVVGDYVMKVPLKVRDLMPEKFNQVLLGHYHIPQELADNVRYVGAPLDLNFGEEKYPKGFCLVDTEKGVEFFTTRYPHFIEVTPEDLKEGRVSKEKLVGNYVRLKGGTEECEEVSGQLEEGKVFYEQVVEKKFEPLRRLPLDLGMELKKMLRLYVELGVVDTGGLDKSRLVKLGEKFLEGGYSGSE